MGDGFDRTTGLAELAEVAIVPSPDAFRDAIDRSHDSAQSVVLRYRKAVRLEPDEGDDERLKALLERTSIREGLRIVPLCTYRGVQIDILDETTMMRTGTLKSIDGCVTTAQCLLRGDRRIVFESGGNTGAALALYGGRVGLETFLFVPAENLDLLDADAFAGGRAQVIAVESPRDVKPAAAAFAIRNGLPRVPELAWRIQASAFVGCFLLERLLEDQPYDVLAQSISAAFGPVGIYRVLGAHRERLGRLPSFLGVQQTSNCAMVRAWRASVARPPAKPIDSTAGLLARVMYDGEPGTYGTFEPLRRILVETGGELVELDHDEFDRGLSTVVDGKGLMSQLARRGVHVTLRDGEVQEKTGLMALAGTVREIESGRIAAGSRVLVCMTGGTARPRGRVVATRWSGEDPHRFDGRRRQPAMGADANV
jgi:hypothetical protein